MPLTLIAGRANAGKTGEAHYAVRTAMSSGRRTALLLPSMPDVRRAQSELSAEFPVGLEITQFDRFIDGAWALEGDGRLLVGPTIRRILLRRAAVDAGVDLPAGGSEGTLDLLGQLVSRGAQEGAVGPSEKGGVRPVRPAIADRLLMAVASYQRLLAAEGLIEPAEATRLLAAGMPPAQTIVANRFVDLTASQEAALSGWADAGADVHISLTWDPEVPATALTAPLVERLGDAGATVRLLPARVEGERPELARLASELFSPASRRPADGDVSLFVAQGEEAEAALVARRVAAWVRDGIAPERIAVVFRDVRRHQLWIRRALAREGVGADIDLRVRFTSTGFARAVRRWTEQEDPADPLAWQNMADRILSDVVAGPAPVTSDVAVECAAHRMFVQAADEALGVHHHGPTITELLDALATRSVSAPAAERPGRVQVIDAESSRARRFDAVVLAGLTAGEFPGGRRGETLEGDAVRSAMRRLGLGDPAGEAQRERMLFYLVVTGARRFLVLSRQEADDEGAAVRPSVFVDELLDLYRDPVTGEGEAPAVERLTLAEVARERSAAASCRTARGGLGDESVERLAGRDTFSPSEIQRYLACPYQWFVDYVMRPAVTAEGIDAMQAGAIAHSVLASVYESLIEQAGGPVRVGTGPDDVELSQALELAEAELSRACPDPGADACLEERQLLSRARAGVLALLERDAAFLPGYRVARVEWGFGRDDGPEDLGGFLLKGQVDRIDMGPDGLVIVDYKSGSATPQAKFAERGLVQLQLYAAVVERRLGEPVVAGLYRGLRSGTDRGFYSADADLTGLTRTDALSAEELRGLLDSAVELAGEAVTKMREGDIAPGPRKDACTYCDWKPLCGGPQ